MANRSLHDQFGAAQSALAELPGGAAPYRSLDDDTLVRLSRQHAALTRALGTVGALIAGEIAHRSAPDLGSAGLARRNGHRTPVEFIKQTTGLSGRDAVAAVRIGSLLQDDATSEPWMRSALAAVEAGTLSIAAADAIRCGLGAPSSAVSREQLEAAVVELCAEAQSMDPDRLAKRARAERNLFDLDGVAIREEERRARRSLTLTLLPDGMARLVWVMDTETTASVKELYDRATSPKLGGIRFVADDAVRADAIAKDDRTARQLASDTFEQLLRQGADADSRFLLGSGAPVIRVAITASALETGKGAGYIEGQPDAVSVATVERLRCGGALLPIVFNEHGQPLDVGREQRLFTRRQRHALALRDGGCMAPGCDRPPSWCEAHHIDHWARDRGETNTADGILLCKHHHLLFHNNGWEIRRDEVARYWLTPPRDVDPEQMPILLTSKSAVMRSAGPRLTALK
jgi:hypothetical protein